MLRRAIAVCAFCVVIIICFSPPINGQGATSSTYASSAAEFQELQAQANGAKTDEARSKLIEAWVDRIGIEKLNLDQVQWCLEHSLPNSNERRSFSVVWTGQITPPQSGKYSFSVSRTNVNQTVGANRVHHAISVTVDGIRAVEAGSHEEMTDTGTQPARRSTSESSDNDWKWKGEPLELRGGQPVPIVVEMHYECREPSAAHSPSAILSWRGPGIESQIIPNDVLTQADGQTSGLQAKYILAETSRQRGTVLQATPNIDVTWTAPANVAPSNPKLVTSLTDRLWRMSTSSDFISECASGSRINPFVASNRCTHLLTSAQRRELLQLLVDNDQLLHHIDSVSLLALYQSARFGVEDEAIDVVGIWMQLNAAIHPEISAKFFDSNRRDYAELAICLRQDAEAVRKLQDLYLRRSDGGCALPAAYTLAYCHNFLPSTNVRIPDDDSSFRHPLHSWIETIESATVSEQLTSAARVSWLLARAQAEEVAGTSMYDWRSLETADYLAGYDWITEAHLQADDNAEAAGIYQEEIARLVAMNQLKRVPEILQAASGKVTSNELRKWKNDSEQVAQLRIEKRRAARQLAHLAYGDILQRRRGKAAARSDNAEVTRYDALIERSRSASRDPKTN